MIYIENEKQHKQVLDFFIEFNKKQTEMETDDMFVYPSIAISAAVKFKILIDELMLHPFVLKKRKFFEPALTINSKKDVVKILAEIIERELLIEDEKPFVSEKNLKKIIKAHKRLITTNNKNGNKSTERSN